MENLRVAITAVSERDAFSTQRLRSESQTGFYGNQRSAARTSLGTFKFETRKGACVHAWLA